MCQDGFGAGKIRQRELQETESLVEEEKRIMKNYMKTMVENYFVKNLVAMSRVGKEDVPAEVLKRNSYTLLNVSPRFF